MLSTIAARRLLSVVISKSCGISSVISMSLKSPFEPSLIPKTHLENYFNFSLFEFDCPFGSLIFLVDVRTSHEFHNYDELVVAYTTSFMVPFGITNIIYLKSTPNIITLPQNVVFKLASSEDWKLSLKILSTSSKQYLCIIGASSHMINFVFSIKLSN